MLNTLHGGSNFAHTVGVGLSYNFERDISITEYKCLKMLAQGLLTIKKMSKMLGTVLFKKRETPYIIPVSFYKS